MSFFDYLEEFRLERNPYGLFELKKEGITADLLGTLLGLNSIVLTPDKEQIINMATMCYLFGLLGINISRFTAVPAGYIATFENEGTFLSFYPDYIIRKFQLQCDKLFENAAEPLENKAYYATISYISKDFIVKDKNTKSIKEFLQLALSIATYPMPNGVKKKLEEAIKKFNIENLNNCKDNDLVLASIVSNSPKIRDDLLKVNLKQTNAEKSVDDIISEVVYKKTFDNDEAKSEYAAKLKDAKALFDRIFDGFIMPGYFIYKSTGMDRAGQAVPKDGMILNKAERISELKGILEEAGFCDSFILSANIIDIYNMCSTDYSADVIYDILSSLYRLTNSDSFNDGNMKPKLYRKVPNNYENYASKARFRNKFPTIAGVAVRSKY